ncbi:MAG: hypothetical protein HY835_07685, partial [Anaerolineae bacterium]|nr:hypothetical protein [Anaerolineae bacterium]
MTPENLNGRELAVKIENVTVRYRVPRERFRTFKEFAIRRLQGRVEFVDLLALDSVNLEVRRGEVQIRRRVQLGPRCRRSFARAAATGGRHEPGRVGGTHRNRQVPH